MKQAIGSTQIINYIIIFIVITFAFLIATLSYMKAFKVNSIIANSIEKYEGANKEYAIPEIQRKLQTIGYRKGTANCDKDETPIEGYNACIKLIGEIKKGNYIRYEIKTYIEFGPLLGKTISLPIKSQTEKIYVFSE